MGLATSGPFWRAKAAFAMLTAIAQARLSFDPKIRELAEKTTVPNQLLRSRGKGRGPGLRAQSRTNVHMHVVRAARKLRAVRNERSRQRG